MTRDFLTAWVLPVAIVLPPVYAMLTPIPLQVLTQWRVHKGVVYRRVFTAAAISLTYGAASLLFRQFPDSFAGQLDRHRGRTPSPGSWPSPSASWSAASATTS